MSCVNLPAVLPGSPSKARGQIQVRGLGVRVGVVAGPPLPPRLCAAGVPN